MAPSGLKAVVGESKCPLCGCDALCRLLVSFRERIMGRALSVSLTSRGMSFGACVGLVLHQGRGEM